MNATGNWPYFIDQIDRARWINLLKQAAGHHEWNVLAFCEMTTHVHAIVDVPDRSLPRGMQYLNREYGKRFNLRHGREGNFVQRRYGSRRIESGRDLVGTYAYVVANPVKARICERAEDWRWSSYATTLRLTSDFVFVDATLVLAELDDSPEALDALVATRAAHLPNIDVSR